MKNKIGAENYVECSSLKQENVTKVFETAFEVGFHYQRKKGEKKTINHEKLYKSSHSCYSI